MDIQTVAFASGIALGIVAVGSACLVWVRHQAFGIGGSALSVVGVALMGLSIWSGIRIEISEAGVSADFQRLAEQVDAMADANQVVTEEVQKIAEATETSRQQFVELTNNLERTRVVSPNALESVRQPVLAAPAIDRDRLNTAAATVDRLRRPAGPQ